MWHLAAAPELALQVLRRKVESRLCLLDENITFSVGPPMHTTIPKTLPFSTTGIAAGTPPSTMDINDIGEMLHPQQATQRFRLQVIVLLQKFGYSDLMVDMQDCLAGN